MTHGSLFDGAGGMRLGFEQAGIETLWTVEILDGQDIHGYGKHNLKRPDIISGGPPCQKTSMVGHINKKNTGETLWPQMLRIIHEIKPQWVVVEQPCVDKAIILAWIEDLQQCGYGVAARIVDSRHWVPQQRSRWFIIGRLGIEGLALWNHLYPLCIRMEEVSEKRTLNRGMYHIRPCPDCVRGGVFAGVSRRSFALMGAGNAVSVPVARWLAERIKEAESCLRKSAASIAASG